MLLTSQIAKLESEKEKIASLEQAIARELSKELAGLPSAYGFESVGDFIEAVEAASGKKGSRKRAGAPKARKGKRAVITKETHREVKKLVKQGLTGLQIAKALGISQPSVQNIKKALGLVKSRGKKVKKSAPRKAQKRAAKKAAPAKVEEAPVTPEAPPKA